MKKIKFKSYKKKSGTLIAFSLVKDFPIKVKRIFVINGKKTPVTVFPNKYKDKTNQPEFIIYETFDSSN